MKIRPLASLVSDQVGTTAYYLMYAIQHGLPEALARELTYLTLIVVTLSIVVHGTSVKPLLNVLWGRRGK